MTECWKCRNNKTNGEDSAKVRVNMRCRLSYSDGYMRTHDEIKGYCCPDFESKES
jgi:hypothetical protein